MNYDEFLSRTARISRTAPIRSYAQSVRECPTPVVNMGPGLPNNDRAYLVGAKFALRDGTSLELSEDDMLVAQQYNASDGIAPLREWLTELVVRDHHPPTCCDDNPDKAMRVIVNSGGMQGISSAAAVLLNRGDKIILPHFFYGSFVESIRRMEPETILMETEDDGPNIEHLQGILSQWNPEDPEKWAERPKAMYIVPNGSNPTGETTSLEKRRKIYALAQKYNFIIVEDDCYYYMQFNEPKLPSFLSMDVDGRVIRCESFSKVVGAGFRVGWVSGPYALVTRMFYEVQYTIQHASVFAQVVLNKMLRSWGFDEFHRKADDLRDYYQQRRDIAAKAAHKHLTGLATWTVPHAGMFLWIKLSNIEDAKGFIHKYALKHGFLMIPGGLFTLDQSESSPYLRAAFAACSESDIDQGLQFLADAVQEASRDSLTDHHVTTESPECS